MFELLNDSHTSGGHLTYLENLYEQFLASPDSVAAVSYTHLTLPTTGSV